MSRFLSLTTIPFTHEPTTAAPPPSASWAFPEMFFRIRRWA
ncbi:MAG: hypothetical protein AB7L28_09680 [Kofleriaceae bacterium]